MASRDSNAPPRSSSSVAAGNSIHSVPLPIISRRATYIKDTVSTSRRGAGGEDSGFDLQHRSLLSRHRDALCTVHKLVSGQQVSRTKELGSAQTVIYLLLNSSILDTSLPVVNVRLLGRECSAVLAS